jgi:hypothetical protein
MFTNKHSKRFPYLAVPLASAMTFAAGCRTYTPVAVPVISPLTCLVDDKQQEYNDARKALDESVLPFMQELERVKAFYLGQQAFERVMGHNTFGVAFYPASEKYESGVYVLEANGKIYVLRKTREFIEACDRMAILDAQMLMDRKTPPPDVIPKTAEKIISIYQNLEHVEMTPEELKDDTEKVKDYLRLMTQATLRYAMPPEPIPAMAQKIQDDLVAFLKSHPDGCSYKDGDEYMSQMTFTNSDGTEQHILIPDAKTLQDLMNKSGWTDKQRDLLDSMKTYREKWDSLGGEIMSKEWHSEEQVLKLWDITMDMFVINPNTKDMDEQRLKLLNTAEELPEVPKPAFPQHR